MHTVVRNANSKRLTVLSFLLTFLMVGWCSVGRGQSTLYWGGSNSDNWNAPKWGTSPNGPFTAAWVNGSTAVFNNANSTVTGPTTTGTTNFGGIVANENVTVTPSSTIGTGGTTAIIDVANGKTLDFGAQNISTAPGTALVKNGLGTFALTAGNNNYPGGFTLNSGTVIIKGVSAFGSGVLAINGGIIAANNSRDLSGKIASITVGGDFTIGATTGLASSGASITFNAPVTLGNSVTRTITIGGTGTYTFSGVIAGSSSNLSLASTANGTLALSGANTYTGATTINGGTLQLSHTGGNTLPSTNNIVVSGGTLRVSADQTVNNFTLSSGKLIIDANTILIINGTYNATGGTIVNNGTLIINGVSTSFPGNGVIVNNGTANTLNSLQIGTSSTVSLNSSLAVSGTLTINGILRPASSQVISGAGALTGNGTIQVTATGNTNDFTSQYTIANKTLDNLTIEFAGAAVQNAAGSTSGHITINNSNGVNMTGDVTLNGALTLKDGIIDAKNFTLTINGSLSRTNGIIDVSTGTLAFAGTSALNIPAGTFSKDINNMLVANAAGVTLHQSKIITGSLTVDGLFISDASVVISGPGTLKGSGTIRVTAAKGDGTNDYLNQYALTPVIDNLTIEFAGAAAQNTAGALAGSVKVSNSNGVNLTGNSTIGGTLTLDVGALNIGSDTLTIAGGVVTNLGTLSGSVSSKLIIGGNAGTLNFTQGARLLQYFAINNNASATLGTPLNIVGGINAGTLIVNGSLNTNDKLILRSNENGTASVGTSAGTVAGNVTVERYIPARRAWRYLTAPLSSAGSVFSQWQNNGVADGKTGIEIWSPQGTGAAGNGIDNGGTAPSAEHYDSLQNKFITLSNTKDAPLSDTKGSADNIPYAVYVVGPYGDKSKIIVNNGAAPTTISTTGKLQMGDQTFDYGNNLPAGNYIMVANPYASAVDVQQITKTNIGNTFWAWDPNLSTRGAYATVSYDTVTKSFTITPSGTAQTQNIENGQAVFVQVDSANKLTNITFYERSKVTSGAAVFRQANTAADKKASPSQELRITLNRRDAASGVYAFADEVVARFNTLYSSKTNDDATKLYGYDENMSLLYGNTKLTILRRPLAKGIDTLFLNIDYLEQNTSYQFTVKPAAFAGIKAKAFLVDTYLKTATPFSLTADSTNLSFATSADAGSYNAKRFVIVLRLIANTTNTLMTSNTAAADKVSAPEGKAAWSVYPNPVKNSTIKVYLNKIPAGKYKLILYSNKGVQLLAKQALFDGAQITYTLQLPAGIGSGTYTLLLQGKDRLQWQQQIIIQH